MEDTTQREGPRVRTTEGGAKARPAGRRRRRAEVERLVGPWSRSFILRAVGNYRPRPALGGRAAGAQTELRQTMVTDGMTK